MDEQQRELRRAAAKDFMQSLDQLNGVFNQPDNRTERRANPSKPQSAQSANTQPKAQPADPDDEAALQQAAEEIKRLMDQQSPPSA
jgi:hypothetical protein